MNRTLALNLRRIFTILITILPAACSSGPSQPPDNFLPPTNTPMPSAATLTISPQPKVTIAPRPAETTTLEFQPKHFSLPIALMGEYALGHPLAYAPCFHWEGVYNNEVGKWHDWFHAGDMYMLNLSNVPEQIVVLSPVTGKIVQVEDLEENDLLLTIETDYFYESRRIFVDVGHINKLFPGDDTNPPVTKGFSVVQGKPIGISDTLFHWGRPEQSLDIAIRNGPAGANPEYDNFSPDSYIDPFPFLSYEIPVLLEKEIIFFDYFREHCMKSGHYP